MESSSNDDGQLQFQRVWSEAVDEGATAPAAGTALSMRDQDQGLRRMVTSIKIMTSQDVAAPGRQFQGLVESKGGV
jgi:hypothetical protein